MKDKKGFLPAHVACSRHCSPEKLEMLLNVNPAALSAKTNDGDTLWSLATSNATASHPNYALIADLEKRCLAAGIPLGQPNLDATATVAAATQLNTLPVSTSASKAKSSSGGSRRGRGRKAKKARTTRKRKVTEDDFPHAPIKQEEEDPATLLLHFSQSHPQDDTNNSNEDGNKKIKVEYQDLEEDVTLFATV